VGSDTQWRDDIEIPAGQPADLETLQNIINNLYALKEEMPLIEGLMTDLAGKTLSSNMESQIQIEVGNAWHGNVVLNKDGYSGQRLVNFKKPFAYYPVVITQPITWGTVTTGSTNLHWVGPTGFSITYQGRQSKIRRGVFYIAIGVRGS
jgi:hypothetical protein